MHDHLNVTRLGILLRTRIFALGILALLWSSIAAAAQDLALRLEPERTTIHFTLVPRSIRCTEIFGLKHGALRLDPASGKLTGEIVLMRRAPRAETERVTGKCTAKCWRASIIRRLSFGLTTWKEQLRRKESRQCEFTEFSVFTERIMNLRFRPKWRCARMGGVQRFTLRFRM